MAIWVGVLFTLYLRQDGLVFPRRQYNPDYELMIIPGTIPLEYEISCGRQKGWYVPPRNAEDPASVPARLWVMFGGNGSVALGWKQVVESSPDAEAGFLLVEYPGYGFCDGSPSVDAIQESSDQLIVRLAEHLETTPEELLDRPVRVMGHSLGSGMATRFALRHKTDRIVMVAPFTSLRAMADGVVTPAFGWILRHRLDNIDALHQLTSGPDAPQVIVIHGTDDKVVPVTMGRQIAKTFPDHVHYVELEGADHVNLLGQAPQYTAPHWEGSGE